MSEPTETDAAAASEAHLEVYWRPGCGFCARLLRALEVAGATVELHNIWDDEVARTFVREHNRGNETVPTIAIAGTVLTNPDPATLVEIVRSRYAHLITTT